MEQGTRMRTTATTHMNANSSRSHMLIILQLKQVSHNSQSTPSPLSLTPSPFLYPLTPSHFWSSERIR